MQRGIVLLRRPQGTLSAADLGDREVPVPAPTGGEVLVRVKLLSIDPYVRTLMDEKPLVGRPVPLGAVIPGRGVGKIVESRADAWKAGQLVVGELGWQEWACLPAAALRAIPASPHPLSWHLGVLGIPGATALIALDLIGEPKEGQSILITSGAGTVGSAAAQIAKTMGCRTFGTAGAKKIATCERLGFDRCVDRGSEKGLHAELAALAEQFDILFDNVGDDSLTIALSMLRPGGRVILCGRIAHYDRCAAERSADPPFELILMNRLRVQGFNVRDHAARLDASFRTLVSLADRGLLKQIDSVCRGLENTPRALQELLAGHHTGKVTVEI